MSFFWPSRLGEPPSSDLLHYYSELMKEPDFLTAVHEYDRAQVVMLARRGFGRLSDVQLMAQALVRMERSGSVAVRQGLVNAVHGGEEYLRQMCGPEVAGLLHVGRSSPSIRVVATRIAIRRRLLAVLRGLLMAREALIKAAAQHTESYMPGYSYLQHIDVTTFGFYLMSWVPVLERDTRRLWAAYVETNESSVGTDGGFGTPFAIGVEDLDELLGFSRGCVNARDAIRNYDYLIESQAGLAIMHSGIARLALDLLIWSSLEFGFVRIADRLSITSSIAPHMRIPYVLEFLSGLAGVTTGSMAEVLAVAKGPSDQLEPATLLPLQVLRVTDESVRGLRVLCEVVDSLEVDVGRMRAGAEASWGLTNSVIAWLVQTFGVPYRTAHETVAEFVRERELKGQTRGLQTTDVANLERRVAELLGPSVADLDGQVRGLLTPAVAVAMHCGRGGTAPAQVEAHAKAALEALEEDKRRIFGEADREAGASRALAQELCRLAGEV